MISYFCMRLLLFIIFIMNSLYDNIQNNTDYSYYGRTRGKTLLYLLSAQFAIIFQGSVIFLHIIPPADLATEIYFYLYKLVILNTLAMFSKFINRGYEAEACQLCKVQFNLFKLERIHKCKRCSKHVCWRCGNYKQKVLDEEGKWTTEVHRVCTLCNYQLTKINTLVSEKKIRWNKDSLFAKQWISKIQETKLNKRLSKTKDYEYQHFLKLFNSNIKNFEQQFQIIEKDVLKGRTDYVVFNYSIKEFFYIVQQGQQKSKCRVNIANVLYAVAARFDQIGYVQGMSSISAFLLCFCSQQTAYVIFCDLIENILPQKFLAKGTHGMNLIGLMAENHFLKQYYIHLLTHVKAPLISHQRNNFTQSEIEHLRMIVQLSSSKALLSCFITFISFLNLNFIWEEFMQKRSFEAAEKAFLAILYLRREEIVQKRSFKDLEFLFENVNHEQFIQAYYDIEIDPQFKQKMIEEFYQSINKKWSDNSVQSRKMLHRCTNFTQDQIKILQQRFLKIDESNKQSKSAKESAPKEIINREDFIILIKCFYNILKENSQEEAPILEIAQFFVGKIFDSFITKKHQSSKDKRGNSLIPNTQQHYSQNERISQNPNISPQTAYLDFRQFVCCFSLCTKSLLKDRMCAIVNTFEDRNKKISLYSFEKLIKNLCEISPEEIEEKKQSFLERMNEYFRNQQEGITINELYILLNDNFINDLTMYIRCDAPDIINKTVTKYFEIVGNEKKQTPH